MNIEDFYFDNFESNSQATLLCVIEQAANGALDRRILDHVPYDHPLILVIFALIRDEDALLSHIRAGININACVNSLPLLHYVVRTQDVGAAAMFIRAGANVSCGVGSAVCFLDTALSPGMCQLLARAWPQDHPLWLHALAAADLADELADAVAAGADVNARDEDGRTPLFWAIQKNSLAAAEVLAEAGADVTSSFLRSDTAAHDHSPAMLRVLALAWPLTSPMLLTMLARAGLHEEVAAAIGMGVDVNAPDCSGRSALYYAVQAGSTATVRALVAAGVDVTACPHAQAALLADRCPDELLRILASAWPHDDPDYLAAQAIAGRCAAAGAALVAGADAAHRWHGFTPLFWAAKRHQWATVEVLLINGADVTELMPDISVSGRLLDREMCQLLARAWPQDDPLRLHALAKADLADEVADAVAAGADVNVRDEKGQTPLHMAFMAHSEACVGVLVEAGADTAASDFTGFLPCDAACYFC